MNTGTAKRLCALDGAKVTIDRGILVVGGTGDLRIPIPTYVIEHTRGLVLFDTGMAPEAVEDPAGTYGDLADFLKLEFSDELRVDKQLEANGYRPSDVTHVIVSHSHLDHTGGISLFPHAKFFIGAPDLTYPYWPFPAAAGFYRSLDLDRARAFDWNLVHGDLDLFGDGSLQILSMPGHTPGNIALLVKLPDRNVILAGDTVHVPEALSDDLPMPSDYSTLDSVHSIRRLKQIAHAQDARVIIQHEMSDWELLREGGF